MLKSPIVIVGTLRPEERPAVLKFLQACQAPVYLESPSGLREAPELQHLRIFLPDQILPLAECLGYSVDGVLRIGGIPTLRLWRDLEEKYVSLPVISYSRLPFSGLSRPSELVVGDLGQGLLESAHTFEFSVVGGPISVKQSEGFLAASLQQYQAVQRLLETEPQSEPGMVHQLSRRLPERTRVYVGNSLPIRQWDLVAEPRSCEVWASRGLNGIDGQVSTFLGYAQAGLANWALLGDLTTLYDLAGPWILSQLPDLQVQIAVLNNGGGQIFSRIFHEKQFLNRHQVSFEGWAALWNVAYEKWESVPTSVASATSRILELQPQEQATARFWDSYAQILKGRS